MSFSRQRNTSHAQRSGDELVEISAARGADRYGRILAVYVTNDTGKTWSPVFANGRCHSRL